MRTEERVVITGHRSFVANITTSGHDLNPSYSPELSGVQEQKALRTARIRRISDRSISCQDLAHLFKKIRLLGGKLRANYHGSLCLGNRLVPTRLST